MRLGAFHYLIKPFSPEALESALEKVPGDQLEKIRGDLDAMRAALGIQGTEGELSQELERSRRSRPSPSRPGHKGIDTERGPDLGR